MECSSLVCHCVSTKEAAVTQQGEGAGRMPGSLSLLINSAHDIFFINANSFFFFFFLSKITSMEPEPPLLHTNG